MRFFRSELEMLYQYAAPTKAETLDNLVEILPVIRDDLTKAILNNTICKLEKIPEPECSQFLAENKARFLEERDNSIRRRLAEAKEQTKSPALLGHDLTGEERFMDATRHMITLDVLSDSSPVGYKGERYRFFLSDEGYRNAKQSEQRGEIKIKSHAAVSGGTLYPDRKLPSRER